jgi:mycoredoxin
MMEFKEGEIIVYGTLWCGDTRRSRSYLDRNQISYRFIDIDRDKEARAFVEKVNHGYRSVPTIIFPDVSMLVEPPDSVLAEKCSLFQKINS